MNFKIQSISDVITNSSTEVFIVIHYSDIEAIKNIVNAILRIDSDLKFDDLFEASFEVEEYALERILDCWDEYKNYFNDAEQPKDYEELDKMIHSLSEASIKLLSGDFNDSQWDSYTRFFSSITINPKEINNNKHAAAARAIESIQSLFELDYYYG
jgi:hypothetical protein